MGRRPVATYAGGVHTRHLTRYLAAGAAAWAGAYAGAYLLLIRAQGDSSPAWWYVGLLLAAVALLVAAALGRWSRMLTVSGTVLLALAAGVAAASIGPYLMPAVVAGAVAAASDRRHAHV